jgi:N-acetyl-anhydromuramoyl-L-alanine amidase
LTISRSGIDRDGWLTAIPSRRVASPNCDRRAPGQLIDTLVVHHISLPVGQFDGDDIERLFTNRLDCSADPSYASLVGLRVSAHFLIRRSGRLIQFVGCDERAWHAGASRLLAREHVNDFSVGVELEGTGSIPYTASQYRNLVRLSLVLAKAYPLRFVVGHSDIAPGRKTDPGDSFDWPHLLAVVDRIPLIRP